MADIAELIVALKLRDGVSGGLGNLNRQLSGMQAGLSQVGKGIGQVGRGLDTAITRGAIAAAAGLGAVITTAASFEQAFTGVEKTVDGTDAQLKELEGTLREMARTMPVSFEELSAIGEAGGALGIARESLDEFVDVVARLAVSTDLSSEAAATALGQLGTVLHLTGSDFEDFADSLVALGNAGASTESQIVELAARFAAAGNSAGLSKEEILALASATASMGIEVEAGGTALSQTFNNIATGIGTGADEINAFTDLLGISAAEFKRRWTEDALGTFTDFLGELSKLDQFEQASVLESAGITGTRQLSAIRLMTQNLGFFSEQLTVAQNAQGALDTESQKFFDTTAGQWKILQNNVRDAAATIGAELLPIVNEAIKEFVGFLSEPGTQQGLKSFAKDLASGIRDFVAEVKKADFGPLLDTMKGAAAIAKGAFDAFRSLPAPIQQLALAAIVANKVTGGAVGQIAGGLGNILKGVIQLRFGRGESPARPMYVSQVGGLGGTGGPGGGPGSGWGRALGVLIGAGVAFELGAWLKQNGPDLFPAAPKRAPGGFVAAKPGGDAAGADTTLLQNFGGKLDKLATNEVIEHLTRTTEVGLKDVGTSFQVGLQTGLDPVGDFATAILERAENPLDPPVMTEILGHIAGLEEIQATYLAQGDVTLAGKVQTNIDTLHALIGTTDTTRTAIVGALASEVGKATAAIFGTKSDLGTRLGNVNAAVNTSNQRLSAIEAKSWQPQVYLTNQVTISATLLEQRLITAKIAAQGSPTGSQFEIR